MYLKTVAPCWSERDNLFTRLSQNKLPMFWAGLVLHEALERSCLFHITLSFIITLAHTSVLQSNSSVIKMKSGEDKWNEGTRRESAWEIVDFALLVLCCQAQVIREVSYGRKWPILRPQYKGNTPAIITQAQQCWGECTTESSDYHDDDHKYGEEEIRQGKAGCQH